LIISELKLKNKSFEMSEIQEIGNNKCFGGFQKIFKHNSSELSCEMNFAVYLPTQKSADEKFPVLYYLSGLTCNETNCVQKGGFQRIASSLGIIVVCPDTSPRNIEGLETAEFSWDFGYGAGFYVDATTDNYKKNFRMYSYITKELINVIDSNFPVVPNKRSIFGHSMGGKLYTISKIKVHS
jgi:S-formylglutathione hydrolase